MDYFFLHGLDQNPVKNRLSSIIPQIVHALGLFQGISKLMLSADREVFFQNIDNIRLQVKDPAHSEAD
jgi:hypothetical protein